MSCASLGLLGSLYLPSLLLMKTLAPCPSASLPKGIPPGLLYSLLLHTLTHPQYYTTLQTLPLSL